MLCAGMTTKYMPLWLFEKVHMSPVGLNFVQALMPLCVALASVFAQELADYIGTPHPASFVSSKHASCQRNLELCCAGSPAAG